MFRKLLNRLFIPIISPMVSREMKGMKLYLDLQHGVKYNIYADSLQASVNRLKVHVDGVKSICAQKLLEYEDRHLADRQTILKQNARIAALEQRLGPAHEMESGSGARPMGGHLLPPPLVHGGDGSPDNAP